MKVAELKELLEQFADNDEVIISDSDGIVFSPLRDVRAGYFFSEDGFSGDFISQDEADQDEDISLDDSQQAICLLPE